MKLLFILSSIHAGGVGQVVQNLSDQYASQSMDVHILSLSQAQKEAVLNDNVKYIYSGAKNMGAPFSLIKNLIFIFKFLQNQKKEFDIVFLPGVIYAIMCIPILKMISRKAKIIMNPHTSFSEYASQQGYLKRILLRWCSFILKKADYIVCDSYQGQKSLQNFYPSLDQTHVIYNPVVSKGDMTYEASRDNAPHQWLKDQKIKVFVGCGRMVETKNFKFMVDVFSQLVKQDESLRLILIGDGPEKENVQQQVIGLNIEDSVSFEGFQNNVKDYLYHANYFWMTSTLEGFPVVIPEALAMGIPVIANDCPSGPREILYKKDHGLLIETYDLRHNVNEIQKFLKKEIRGKSYYREHAKDFMIEKSAQHYLDLIND